MPVTWEAKHLARRYQNTVNNAQGHFFEDAIKAGCAYYSARGRAEIDKTPEPFRVMEKLGGGGHRTIAGAQLQGVTIEEARQRVKEVINLMIEKGEVS